MKKYGDGRWVAQWNTAVFHQNLFGYVEEEETVRSFRAKNAGNKIFINTCAHFFPDQLGARSCHLAHLRWQHLQVHREIGTRVSTHLHIYS